MATVRIPTTDLRTADHFLPTTEFRPRPQKSGVSIEFPVTIPRTHTKARIMGYWLMKSEPDVFGLEDLKARPKKTEPWDGIRNYQARNFIRDDMRKGDQVFFYHSNCAQPGIVGIAKIVSSAYPDPTQFDADSKYFDAKSDPEDPRWLLVDVKYQRTFKRPVTLAEMKARAEEFDDFKLLARGNRLSIMPVTEEQWNKVLELEKETA